MCSAFCFGCVCNLFGVCAVLFCVCNLFGVCVCVCAILFGVRVLCVCTILFVCVSNVQ